MQFATYTNPHGRTVQVRMIESLPGKSTKVQVISAGADYGYAAGEILVVANADLSVATGIYAPESSSREIGTHTRERAMTEQPRTRLSNAQTAMLKDARERGAVTMYGQNARTIGALERLGLLRYAHSTEINSRLGRTSGMQGGYVLTEAGERRSARI